MKLFLGLGAALALLPVHAASAATVDQGIGYVLSADGTTVSRIDDLSAPSLGTSVTLMSGGTALSVEAITYRPNTREFYAYDNQTNAVYSFDVDTGQATLEAQASGTNGAGQAIRTTTNLVGFDFNNQVDAARIVSRNDENLVFFPAGSVGAPGGTPRTADIIRATDLFYEAGDANEGANPSVVANAYTNAVPQFIGSTQQYVLDSDLDILATLGNNSGELRTIGEIFVDGAATALDFNVVAGFDILSPAEGDNLGIALLNSGGTSTLYAFDVTTTPGAVRATTLGTIGSGFISFTVAPVPVPASVLLMLGGLAGLAATRRVRGRKAA